MHTKARIEKFYADLEALGLQHPVAAITRATGYSKGNVSEWLSRKKEPSANFLDKFYAVFYKGSNNQDIEKRARDEPNPDPSKVVLTGAHVTLQDYIDKQEQRIAELKRDKDMLYALLNSNLVSLKEGQQIMIAYQKAWVDHVAQRESKGDQRKKEEIAYKMGKLVDDILMGDSYTGTHVESGKHHKG